MITLEIDSQSCGEAKVIRRQLDAYSARDIEAFRAFWALDAGASAGPDTLFTSCAEAIRIRHVERFKDPDLFAKLISRVDVGGLARNREVMTRSFPEGRGALTILHRFDLLWLCEYSKQPFASKHPGRDKGKPVSPGVPNTRRCVHARG